MAKLNSPFSFSGSLDGFSVYTMAGVKQPVVRKKGGPSKQKLESSSSCVNCLKNGQEFGGRSLASGLIKEAWLSVASIIDGSCMGQVNSKLTYPQELDTVSAWGERHVLLSKRPELLEGFELAHTRPFDAVVQNSFGYTLSKDTMSAKVEIPALMPGINFTPRGSFPFFRLRASLGVVPDMLFDKQLNDYLPSERFAGVLARETETGWMVVKGGAPATTLDLILPHKPSGSAYSLMLTIGIDFGTMSRWGEVEAVKRTGSAKILAMA